MRDTTWVPALLVLALAWGGGASAMAQTPAADSTEPVVLEEIIVVARRPGHDPSAAATECLWAHIPADQRRSLEAVAARAGRTLSQSEVMPLTNPGLTDEAVLEALVACGGRDDHRDVPFAHTALATFAIEQELARLLAAERIPRQRLLDAWSRLTPSEQDSLLLAASTAGHDLGDRDLLADAVFRLLRTVRPVQAFNPLTYRVGSTNHRILYFAEAHAVRRAMERRF